MKVPSKQISRLCDILRRTSWAPWRFIEPPSFMRVRIICTQIYCHRIVNTTYCEGEKKWDIQRYCRIELCTSAPSLLNECFFSGADAFREWTTHGCKTKGALLAIPSLWGDYKNLSGELWIYQKIFVFQGYEGSLLKVTSKNGKTASVSFFCSTTRYLALNLPYLLM